MWTAPRTWQVAEVVTAAQLNEQIRDNMLAVVPVGTVLPFAGPIAPSGGLYLLCDGTEVSRSTYADLFAILGTSYGVGNGSTTFNLPDLRGRVPVGKGLHSDVDALGDNDGAAAANRRPKHGHSPTTPAGANQAGGSSNGTTYLSRTSQFADYGAVQIGPAAPAPQDTPSYVVLNFIIKARQS